MTWARLAAGLLAAGFISGATAQAAPLPSVIEAFPGASASVETVQYYYYDDYEYAPAPPRYRVYRQPPAYGYYGPPQRYYGPPSRGYVERQKEAVKDYRRAQKEIFKERVRGWNRTHGF
jgi:hypothetical protein